MTTASAFRAGLNRGKPDTRPLHEWAVDNVRFPGSPLGSAFRAENIPFLIEPMRAWSDPLTWAVSVLAGVQGCKTGFMQTATAHAMSKRPGNILVTAQTDAEATFFNKTKLLPCLRESPATKNLLLGLGREDLTKEHIILPGMFVQIQGPSLGGLQSKTIHYLENDEVWRWPKGTMDELLRRTNAVRNRKVLSVSQGGSEIVTATGETDWCEWGSWYHQGTQEEFQVRCPHCPEFFPPELRDPISGKFILCWDDDESTRHLETKQWRWQAVRTTVRMQCPHCDGVITNRERDRRNLVQNWRYVPTNDNPSPGHRSFRYSGLALWWRDWADIAEAFLRAKDSLRRGDIEPLKKFVQKEEARFWTLKDAEIPVIRTAATSGYRIETYERKPEDTEAPKIENEERRFLDADMQSDRFPLIVRAFSATGSRLLLATEVKSFEEIKALEIEYNIPSALVGLDVGNWRAEALRACVENKWTALRGRDVNNFTKQQGGRKKPARIPYQAVLERLTGDAKHHGKTVKVWEFSNPYYKDLFSRLRAMPEHQIPDDVPQEYLEAMESERKDPATGIYKRIGNRANHYWDAEIMCSFMASLYKLVGAVSDEADVGSTQM